MMRKPESTRSARGRSPESTETSESEDYASNCSPNRSRLHQTASPWKQKGSMQWTNDVQRELSRWEPDQKICEVLLNTGLPVKPRVDHKKLKES